VEERRHRLDAVGEQGVDESLVEAEPGSFTAPRPSGRTRPQAMLKRYAVRPSRFISATSSSMRR
jgi:hypothetical protein